MDCGKVPMFVVLSFLYAQCKLTAQVVSCAVASFANQVGLRYLCRGTKKK